MSNNYEKIAKDLAEAHVSWFLETLRPLLISHMIHGFKHGCEFTQNNGGKEPADKNPIEHSHDGGFTI